MSTETAKKSVRKGKSGEREFIQAVYRLTDGAVRLKRNLNQSREGGDDIRGAEPLSFEIKRYSRVTDALIKGWWQQAYKNARAQNKKPVLAYRADQQGWKVVMHPNHYFNGKDVRGCMTMDIELFCQFLTHQKEIRF